MLPNVSRQPPYQPKPSRPPPPCCRASKPAAQGFLRSCWAVTRLRNQLAWLPFPLLLSAASPPIQRRASVRLLLAGCPDTWLALPRFRGPTPVRPRNPGACPPLFFFSLQRGTGTQLPWGMEEASPLSILVWRALRNMPLLLRITYHRVSGAGLDETRWSRRLWCHAI